MLCFISLIVFVYTEVIAFGRVIIFLCACFFVSTLYYFIISGSPEPVSLAWTGHGEMIPPEGDINSWEQRDKEHQTIKSPVMHHLNGLL